MSGRGRFRDLFRNLSDREERVRMNMDEFLGRENTQPEESEAPMPEAPRPPGAWFRPRTTDDLEDRGFTHTARNAGIEAYSRDARQRLIEEYINQHPARRNMDTGEAQGPGVVTGASIAARGVGHGRIHTPTFNTDDIGLDGRFRRWGMADASPDPEAVPDPTADLGMNNGAPTPEAEPEDPFSQFDGGPEQDPADTPRDTINLGGVDGTTFTVDEAGFVGSNTFHTGYARVSNPFMDRVARRPPLKIAGIDATDLALTSMFLHWLSRVPGLISEEVLQDNRLRDYFHEFNMKLRERQYEESRSTLGMGRGITAYDLDIPGHRDLGVLDHIAKDLIQGPDTDKIERPTVDLFLSNLDIGEQTDDITETGYSTEDS